MIAPAKVTFHIPDSMTYEQGACVEPASVGYHGARRGVSKGDTVVVMGAGTIGFFAMQGAKGIREQRKSLCVTTKPRTSGTCKRMRRF